MSRSDDRAAARAEKRADRRAQEQGSAAADEATPRTRTGPVQFLREVRGELRKVAWPNRKELVNYTVVVLAVTIVLTALTYGFDELIRNAILNTLG